MSISRTKAGLLGLESVTIIERGHYQAFNGQRVEVKETVKAARENTVAYEPGVVPQVEIAGSFSTTIEVANISTLQAGKQLQENGLNPLALNFASAKNPGGGFLSGARAQEESLCRASGLYACLNRQPYYDHHRKLGGGFYTDYALYSPNVPIWRDEKENLLNETWPLSFITMAAPNYRAHGFDPSTKPKLLAEFDKRIRKILLIALANHHPSLVLGAWGCGAFGNDSQDVAPIFAKHLKGEFSGVFQHIIFAILDRSEDKHFIGPFEEMLYLRRGTNKH
jgi:uncharacterized protein (TIGR02452 family)